jgi:hypothetical protein
MAGSNVFSGVFKDAGGADFSIGWASACAAAAASLSTERTADFETGIGAGAGRADDFAAASLSTERTADFETGIGAGAGRADDFAAAEVLLLAAVTADLGADGRTAGDEVLLSGFFLPEKNFAILKS